MGNYIPIKMPRYRVLQKYVEEGQDLWTTVSDYHISVPTVPDGQKVQRLEPMMSRGKKVYKWMELHKGAIR